MTVYTLPLNRMRSSIQEIAPALLEQITRPEHITFEADVLPYLRSRDWSDGNVRALRRLLIRTWTTFHSTIRSSGTLTLDLIISAEEVIRESLRNMHEQNGDPSLVDVMETLHHASEKLEGMIAHNDSDASVSSEDLSEVQDILRKMLSACSAPEFHSIRSEQEFLQSEALAVSLNTADPPEFENFMKAMQEIRAAMEVLGRQLHESYALIHKEQFGDRELVDWNSLSDEKKRSNILQLIHLPQFFIARGYALRVVREREIRDLLLREKDVLAVAKAEHRRWRKEVQSQGWKYGEQRDEARKTNPHVVPWEKLDDRAKELTMNAVRVFPRLLKSISVEVYRNR